MTNAGQREGADNAGVIAPPPLIGLATLVLGFLADWLFPMTILRDALNWPARIAIGAVLFVVGGIAVLAAKRAFGRAGTNVPPWEPTLALATSGIYERVRNPMYVGAILMLAGIAIGFASEWILMLLIPTALILHYGVVLREERYLEAKFGEDYRAYKARVPRYGLPR